MQGLPKVESLLHMSLTPLPFSIMRFGPPPGRYLRDCRFMLESVSNVAGLKDALKCQHWETLRPSCTISLRGQLSWERASRQCDFLASWASDGQI